MKKIIFAISVMLVLAFEVNAANNDDNKKLLKDLKYVLENTFPVKWVTTSDFTKTTFVYNSRKAMAYYMPDGELIGFFIKQENAPKEVTDAVHKKYKGWEVQETQMFIDRDGTINYFMLIKEDKHKMVLKSTPGGKLSVY